MAAHVEALAALPLQHQPGEAWEYSVSTDVLGRIVEIVAGAGLGEMLRERIFAPLGMGDTAFYTPKSKVERRAEAFSWNAFSASRLARTHDGAAAFRIRGRRVAVDNRRLCTLRRDAQPRRRARRRANSGARTIAFMASDHLGPMSPRIIRCSARVTASASASAGAHRARPRLHGGKRRRIFLGRHRGTGSGFRRATSCSRS